MSDNLSGQMTWKVPGTTDCSLHLRYNNAELAFLLFRIKLIHPHKLQIPLKAYSSSLAIYTELNICLMLRYVNDFEKSLTKRQGYDGVIVKEVLTMTTSVQTAQYTLEALADNFLSNQR
jgi:hypothetical protein